MRKAGRDRRNSDLTGKKNMLAGLGHRTIGGTDNQNGSIHLGGTGNHVFNIIGVAGTVHMRVVAFLAFVLDVGGGNGDAASLLFGSRVDLIVGACLSLPALGEHRCDCRRESGLAMIHVSDRADVHVVFIALECVLSHMGGLCLWLFCVFFGD
jgi:hypothetical protein